MTWRIVLAGDGHTYLVHVSGESEKEARSAAKRKIALEFRPIEIRVESAERIPA